MRTLEEIKKDKRLVGRGSYNGNGDFWGSGYLNLGGNRVFASVVFGSNENGWEHVSIDLPGRNPTWDEMCLVKDIFWRDDEECIQFHPKKSEYVNVREHCLHIWRNKAGMNVPGM